MITYTLNKENMLVYLQSKLEKAEKEILKLNQEKDAALHDYLRSLDAAISCVDTILQKQNNVILELLNYYSEKYDLNPSTFIYYKRLLLQETTTIYGLDTTVTVKNYKEKIEEDVIRTLTRIKKDLEKVLKSIDTDNPDTANYYHDAFLKPSVLNDLRSKLDLQYSRFQKWKRLIVNCENLTCKIKSLNKEIGITKLSDTVSFPVTSECTL